MYLNVHSYYSLRYGTIPLETLVNKAKGWGVKELILTDINNTTAVLDFVQLAKDVGIIPIGGVDVRNKDSSLYILIAKNSRGFYQINQFLSRFQLRHQDYPAEPNIGEDVFVIYPLESYPERDLNENEWIGVRPRQLLSLFSHPASRQASRLVVLHSVSFQDEQYYDLHKHLRAIDNNILLSQLKETYLASVDDVFMHPDQLEKIYENHQQIITNTKRLLSLCRLDFNYTTVKNKATFTGDHEDDRIFLEKLAYDGFKYRYPSATDISIKRLKHELSIIHQLGFSAYFLITWDIIRYSMSRGFYHVGRGSGANSLVAYCLRITDVDPIELDLYFERFLNPKRTSPPDFDIDYSWKERDEVIDYIFKRYGREHTALLGTMSTFKGKSIYRELGKVYGLPKEEIDRLVKYPDQELNKNEITKKIDALAVLMRGYPNMRGIHAGGILISEEPICQYGALDMPPKGFPTIQWDMYVAENIGFEKLDILSQRGIGHIKEAADIILENKKIAVDVHAIQEFKIDAQIRETLKNGETIGCFYVESPAMRQLLKKLRCSDYLSLVAASSIIRPGVARSGMMREYIKRFHHPQSFEYLHPVMKEQLQETYGVMVFQEDVLKVCHHFAGLDLADSDVLRRAMSGKYRSKKEFRRIVDKFFSNCKERGYSDGLTKEVWRQIESFAGYSFSKAHSASYAVESYQSLFLKTYYPLEFMTAVINNFGGYYHTWVYFNEAKNLGAQLELPCVNHSNYKTRLIDDVIYVGFVHVQNLERKWVLAMEKDRERGGVFGDLPDFVARVRIGLEQIVILIKLGAFRFTGKTKAQLLWEAHMLINKSKARPQLSSLFRPELTNYRLPKFTHVSLEDAYDEIELIGFPVSLSLFEMLQTKFRAEVKAKDLASYLGQKVRMLGQLVTIKYVKTIRMDYMNFGTFLDDRGAFFDTVHFPNSLKVYPFRGDGIYLILGKVVEEFGFTSLEVEKMAKLPLQADPRSGD
jgi:DNA polymerase-3 subunit alpha